MNPTRMFERLRGMFGGEKPRKMQDPNEQRRLAAEAAQKKRETAEKMPSVRVVRPSEIHRRDSRNTPGKNKRRHRGTDAPPKSHDVRNLGKATPEQLAAAMRKIEEAGDSGKAA